MTWNVKIPLTPWLSYLNWAVISAQFRRCGSSFKWLQPLQLLLCTNNERMSCRSTWFMVICFAILNFLVQINDSMDEEKLFLDDLDQNVSNSYIWKAKTKDGFFDLFSQVVMFLILWMFLLVYNIVFNNVIFKYSTTTIAEYVLWNCELQFFREQ